MKKLNIFSKKTNISTNLVNSGNVNLKLGKNHEAAKDFLEAIHGDHLNISAWLGFAEAAKRSGLIPRITDLVEKI
jgi:hypothetical protein